MTELAAEEHARFTELACDAVALITATDSGLVEQADAVLVRVGQDAIGFSLLLTYEAVRFARLAADALGVDVGELLAARGLACART